jgi:hypothetical protein
MKDQVPSWLAGVVKKKVSDSMYLVVTGKGV